MARFAVTVAVCSLALGCLAEWTPLDGVNDLDAVELALHKVENAKLTSEQKKIATKTVGNVEKVIEEIKTDKKLTKAQRMDKVRTAIQSLQGLQSQWELASVETSLNKVIELPHLSSKQRTAAKKVVADVESVVQEVESGKLTGEAQKKKVGLAIQELQSLEREWANVTTADRVEALQKELAAKKVLLKEKEAELKLTNLEKELAEKKLLLKKLTAEKDQAEATDKQRKEDEAQQQMVAKLLATAQALAASRKSQKTQSIGTKQSAIPSNTSVVNAVKPIAADVPLKAIISDLHEREHNISASIDRMDASEKQRESEMTKSIEAAEKGPASGKTDATKKGDQMLKKLLKQERRSFLKARALRESQRKELQDGIDSIQKGDVAALSSLMAKMQEESKSMQAKTKNFLY